MSIQYFDIHSHLYFPDYDPDREDVISKMKELGIYTTAIGTNIDTSKQSVAIADKHENIYASIGLHPGDISGNIFESDFDNLVSNPKVVSVGECGFDFFKRGADANSNSHNVRVQEKYETKDSYFFRTSKDQIESEKEVQKVVFDQQVQFAVKHGKSLMIHSRPSKGSMDAYEATLEVLETYAKQYGDKLTGNVHFFVGDIGVLKRFLDIGFTVSFTGVISFTRDYDELVKYPALSQIHAETDAPFVAPASHRGKRNSPEYIIEILEAIAKIRGEDLELVKTTLVENAKRLFKI
jgi:TatD DNase family protein